MKRAAPWLLALLLVVAGAAVLRDYGLAWDEALGDLFFGDRTLSYFLTFDGRYLDPASNMPSHPPSLALSPFRSYPWEYFPAASTLAAATSRILGAMGVDPFDGFHALNLLLAAILLVALYRTVEKHESTAAAAAAVLFLFLSPRIVADLMVNIKDFPEMVFFSLTLLAFFAAWERSSLALYLLSGALWGLALATKTNAIFIPFVCGAFLLWERRRPAGWSAGGPAGALLLGPLVAFATWPYLWPAPITRVSSNLHYIATRASITQPANASNPYLMLFWSTSLLFLAFLAAGTFSLHPLTPFRKLVICWAAVVLLRLPLSINFDVVRHFLELFPALAVIAGIGFARIPRPALAVPLLAAALAVPVVRAHPFETAYWNLVAGKAPQSGDYWAVSYRKGMEWLNAHIEHDAMLAVPIAEHTVALAAPARLRPDIHLLVYAPPTRPTYDLARLQRLRALAEKQPVYVMFILRDDWANETTIWCTTSLRPVAEWRAGGRALMRIYRL